MTTLIRFRSALTSLFLLLSLWSFHSAADEIGPEEKSQIAPALQLANDYINALTERDFRHLGRMLHRDTKFEDEMAGKKITGTRDILNFLRRVHVYTESYAFVIDHQFYKGSKVVMIGSYYYQAKGTLFGMPDKLITLSIPGITTLKVDVRKQRIDSHIDILDYATMRAQLKLYQFDSASEPIQ